MRASLLLTSLLSSSLALAFPSSRDASRAVEARNEACMSSDVAAELIAAYERLVGGITEGDEDYISDSGFTDTSDSINVLTGKPLGSVTFPSKDAFITAQENNPHVSVTVVDYIVACDSLGAIWKANFPDKPVRGVSILKAVMENGKWSFKSFDVEFNSITWAENIA